MTDFIKGIKAGVVAGIIYGALNGIVGTLTTSMMMESYSTTIPGLSSYWSPFLIVFSIIWGCFYGAFIGLIVGVIYAALYTKLPGTQSMVKAITLLLLFWLVFYVGIGFVTYSFMRTVSITYSNYFEISIVSGLIVTVIFGITLGFFYDRFKGENPTCSQCGRNIPKDAHLCPYCGKIANPLIQNPEIPS